jgi:membrane protein
MSEPSRPPLGPQPPRRSLRRGLRWLVGRPKRIGTRLSQDRIFGMSAEAGFWGLVSLPSLALAVFGAIGYLSGVIGPTGVARIHDDVLRAARDLLSPTTVTDDVAPLVQDTLRQGHVGVLSVSFIISLWSGSACMSAYVNTITVAYGMRGVRGAVRSRIVALGLYLLAVVAGIALLPALILGPEEITDLAPESARSTVRHIVSAAYWPGVVVGSVLVIATLYRLCLPLRVRWRAHLPGAVLAMSIWLGGSVLLRSYVSEKLRNTNLSYGALGAPVAALLFFYVTALAVLVGAELNAALRAGHEARVTERLLATPAPPNPVILPLPDD